MTAPKARRHVRGASSVGLASGLALLVLVGLQGRAWLGWAVSGWAPMVLIGVLAGGCLAIQHGKPGRGFVVALLAGMLARLLAVGVGVGLASWKDGVALRAYLEGFALGFVPLLVFEGVFFYGEGRTLDRVSRLQPGRPTLTGKGAGGKVLR